MTNDEQNPKRKCPNPLSCAVAGLVISFPSFPSVGFFRFHDGVAQIYLLWEIMDARMDFTEANEGNEERTKPSKPSSSPSGQSTWKCYLLTLSNPSQEGN